MKRIEQVREIIEKHKGTGISVKKLSEKVSGQLGITYDNARTQIRAILQKRDSDYGSKTKLPQDYLISDSIVKNYAPYIIPDTHENILILSDMHFPKHNKEAILRATGYGLNNDVDCIVLNGDITDCDGLGSYDADRNADYFEAELKHIRAFLCWLRKEFPYAKIIYKEGNHEERFVKYIHRNARKLTYLEEFTLEYLFKLKDLGIDYIGDKRIIQYMDYNIFHGHEMENRFGAGVMPSRTNLNKTLNNTICGHVHSTSSYKMTDSRGKTIRSYTMGCLTELNPRYNPVNTSRNLGFGLLRGNQDGAIFENREITKSGLII